MSEITECLFSWLRFVWPWMKVKVNVIKTWCILRRHLRQSPCQVWRWCLSQFPRNRMRLTQTHTDTDTQTQTHARTHARRQTDRHTDARTHAHTHRLERVYVKICKVAYDFCKQKGASVCGGGVCIPHQFTWRWLPGTVTTVKPLIECIEVVNERGCYTNKPHVHANTKIVIVTLRRAGSVLWSGW